MFSLVNCCELYKEIATVHNVLSHSLRMNAIRNYCISQVSDDVWTTICTILELIMLSYNVIFLPNSGFITCEICNLISFICAS